jgi:hypothetical protein
LILKEISGNIIVNRAVKLYSLYFTHKVKLSENFHIRLKILKNTSKDLEMVQKCKKI